MRTVKINLEEDWGLSVTCAPAVIALNPIFAAAYQTLIEPHALAIAMGKLPEERAQELQARLWASAVIVGSPTPGPDQWGEQEWTAWLLREPHAFAVIRSLTESKLNFDPNNVVRRSGHGESAGAGEEA